MVGMEVKLPSSSGILKQGGLFNRRQIADYIGVSERTISNMMRQRLIPVIKFGRSVRFDPVKVRKALEKYEIEEI
jgi:excisionase family DNA binding protein